VRIAGSVAKLAGPGARRVVGMAHRLPLRDAAIVNGMLMHGLDYDDTHAAGVIHLTVSTFPAGLATAAHVGASGAELLTAYVAGVSGARIASVVKERPAPGGLPPHRRGGRLRFEPGRLPIAAPIAGATRRRAGHRPFARERQPAVHRGRLVDEAHPPGLERRMRHHRRLARRRRLSGATRSLRRAFSASIAAICRRTCSRNPTCPWRPPA
jgi:hypothetical protein